MKKYGIINTMNRGVNIKKEKILKILQQFHELSFSWQIYSVSVLYLLITMIAFVRKWEIGILLFVLFLLIVVLLAYNINRFIFSVNEVAGKLVMNLDNIKDDVMNHTPIGILMYDEENRVVWGNHSALSIINKNDIVGKKLEQLSDEFTKILSLSDTWDIIKFSGKTYKIAHKSDVKTIYWIDFEKENEIIEYKKYNQLVFGYLLIDDYDELVQSLNDQEVADFDATLVTKLNEWAQEFDVYLKRIEDDKYMMLLNKVALEKIEEFEFKFFSELRDDYHSKNSPLSFSLGIAYANVEQFVISDLAKEAQFNLDLALARGGDQIVVKANDESARFYGGETQLQGNRTNTRSKLVYQALINQIKQASNVLIAGHVYPDMDSIGSALGIYKIVTEQRKMAKIIVNESQFNSDIQQLLSSPQISYNLKNIFLNHDSVREYMSSKTLIILVDHHRPSLSEAKELILKGYNTVIIDHHRRSEDFPAQSVLTYIEPYASSTGELITEFFMNMRNTIESLNHFEATALLAGIIVDTNNFSNRTGSRTFDAASYLKGRGADTEQIQRILKEDLELVKKRNHLIEKTEIVYDEYAISCGTDETIIDNITAAQAADNMLNLKHVEASFVIYRRSADTVAISARSIGQVNVQKIMESLGGGGHLSNAATQIDQVTVEEVKQLLLEKIENRRD
ncbi:MULTISPECIES: DHH family phosphoesterase [unclassified Facklamia]|uniref:DHH family phosphoesterase n=1 Tax=Aerococcaceae TaxID=186827 RepID=UPI0013B69379|nr:MULTISPECIES: DHH family phosphoesterase [unclassified Facklamia]NEW64963.1 RNA-binding protein [Facklamia sp. 252]NEW68424.1 RNA-binding protein [Facklamia sp. 253]QQD65563.1 DHH family phosphoesterase [Aerococcaceae bacterium zg-252]